MLKNKRLKIEALKLHQGGVSTSQIAAKLKVSARTIQRWLKDETSVSVQVFGTMADQDAPLSFPKDIEKRRDEFDTEFSRRIAVSS